MVTFGDPPRCSVCGAYFRIYSSGEGYYCVNGCKSGASWSASTAKPKLWDPASAGTQIMKEPDVTAVRPKFDLKKMEAAGRLMLEAMGDDPTRDGLKDTPRRFARYYSQIMNGYELDPKDYVTEFDNDADYDGAVVVKDLPFYTVCEHHLAPFIGTWDVAYKPDRKIVGLSKLVRIARVFQKRPQVQERLTRQIVDSLDEILHPIWVVVRMQAEHFCMSTRGVRTPGAMTETMSGHGIYPRDVFTSV